MFTNFDFVKTWFVANVITCPTGMRLGYLIWDKCKYVGLSV